MKIQGCVDPLGLCIKVVDDIDEGLDGLGHAFVDDDLVKKVAVQAEHFLCFRL